MRQREADQLHEGEAFAYWMAVASFWFSDTEEFADSGDVV
jgi:hypothetical protein